jgi:hypothetical protein
MDQSLACPHCGQIVLNLPALAGQLVQCPGCYGQFQLPMLAVPVPSPAVSSTRNSVRARTPKRRSWLWVLAFLIVFGWIGTTIKAIVKGRKGNPESAGNAKQEREEQRKQEIIEREKQRQHEQEMADIFSGKSSRIQEPTMRFGLTEEQRREYFRELVLLEDRLGIHTAKAMAAKEALRRRYNISREQGLQIFMESHEENWPLPPAR